MISNLATAIWNKFNGDSGAGGLNASGGLSLFSFQQAPQVSTSPYGVFYLDGFDTDEQMGNADNKIEMGEIRIQIFSSALDGGVIIADLMNRVMTLYDWSTLTISSYTALKMSREAIAPLIYEDQIWQATLMYSAWFIKT